MTIGLVAELDGNIQKAKSLYERALRSIDGDPKIGRGLAAAQLGQGPSAPIGTTATPSGRT